MQPEHSTSYPEFDPEFVQHLEGVKSFAETYTESTLQRERSGKRLSQIIRKIDTITDQEMDRIRQALEYAESQGAQIPKLDCKPGCSACCYRPVPVTVPEVLAIGKYLEENFSKEDMAVLNKRLDSFVKDTEKCRADDYSRCRAACPYLVDDLCSIYPARPLICRTRNSTEVAACEEVKKNPDAHVDVPSMPMMNAAGASAIAGLRQGLFFEAADNGLVDLGVASQIMFANTNAAELYLQGANVFGKARVPMPPDPFDNPKYAESNIPSYVSEMAKNVPAGRLSVVDEDSLRFYYDLGPRQARYDEAIRALVEDTAVHQMARITVPRVYRSEVELREWREHYAKALHDFDPTKYNAKLAFNALHVDTPGLLSYQGQDDKELMMEHGKLACGIAERAVPELTTPIEKRAPGGALRVGYLSANICDNTAALWSLGWIRNHGEGIESYVFNVGETEDEVSRQFRDSANYYFHLVRHVPEAGRFIRSLELDVLIFTDIGMNGLNTVFSSLRLAPVQCTAWGSHETTGLPTIDYYLSSELMEPQGADSHYSEKLVKLPGTGIVYPRFAWNVSDRTRTGFGLMGNRHLIVNAQSKPKLLPREDHLWAEIAERAQVPIVFLESSSPGETSLIKKRMAKAGVRAQWLPPLSRPDYLALLRHADVVVDTVNFNGGVTTIEALTMGTPVVSLSGPFRRGRQSRAFLTQASAAGLIAKDEKEFVELAADFDRQKHAAMELNVDALFEDPSPVLELDKFLRKVVGS